LRKSPDEIPLAADVAEAVTLLVALTPLMLMTNLARARARMRGVMHFSCSCVEFRSQMKRTSGRNQAVFFIAS
jgi:hypothetical protein